VASGTSVMTDSFVNGVSLGLLSGVQALAYPKSL
jgi:hypothetical protein